MGGSYRLLTMATDDLLTLKGRLSALIKHLHIADEDWAATELNDLLADIFGLLKRQQQLFSVLLEPEMPQTIEAAIQAANNLVVNEDHYRSLSEYQQQEIKRLTIDLDQILANQLPREETLAKEIAKQKASCVALEGQIRELEQEMRKLSKRLRLADEDWAATTLDVQSDTLVALLGNKQ